VTCTAILALAVAAGPAAPPSGLARVDDALSRKSLVGEDLPPEAQQLLERARRAALDGQAVDGADVEAILTAIATVRIDLPFVTHKVMRLGRMLEHRPLLPGAQLEAQELLQAIAAAVRDGRVDDANRTANALRDLLMDPVASAAEGSPPDLHRAVVTEMMRRGIEPEDLPIDLLARFAALSQAVAGPADDVDPAWAQLPQAVTDLAIDGAFVQRKLARLNHRIAERGGEAGGSAELLRLMQRVGVATFNRRYDEANALLNQVGDLLDRDE